jgi:hypothetical protein
MWTIYCHTHVDSGFRYVGQTTTSWQRRWKTHLQNARRPGSNGRSYFANAIRLYGGTAFTCEVLATCTSQEEADAAERSWIARFNSNDRRAGFNIMPGGQGANTLDLVASGRTPEHRARKSAETKALWQDPAHRAAMAVAIPEGNRAARAADPTERPRPRRSQPGWRSRHGHARSTASFRSPTATRIVARASQPSTTAAPAFLRISAAQTQPSRHRRPGGARPNASPPSLKVIARQARGSATRERTSTAGLAVRCYSKIATLPLARATAFRTIDARPAGAQN